MTDFNKKPDIVIAGDVIYAGIDSDDQSEIPCAIVIQFENKEQMCEAMMATSNIWFPKKDGIEIIW